MKRPAYLEISPRLTGKTQRLISLAQGRLDAGRKVCFNTILPADIRRRLPDALVIGPKQQFPSDLDATEYDRFFDEFDWLETAEFVDGGFYATTPKFMRSIYTTPADDLLLQLLEANEGVLTRNYFPSDMWDWVQEDRAHATPEQFRRLYLGEFFE